MPKDQRPATSYKSSRAVPYHLAPMDRSSPPPHERPSTAWSQEDDALLMQCRAQGMNWAPIAHNHFPSKTSNACRKRHERLMEKRNAESWDGIKVEDLAKAYMEVREDMWRLLGEKVGEKWQTVETKVATAPRRPNRPAR